MSYVLAVTWVAKPGEEQAVEGALKSMLGPTRAEPGCIQYDAFRSTENPRQYFLFERYHDEAAFQAHASSEHFKKHVLGEAVPRLESRVRTFYEPL
jgi:autoinducer 2-degrading protein